MKLLYFKFIALACLVFYSAALFAFAIPKPPANLVATAISATQINLTWQDASKDETVFELERSLNGTSFTKLADLPVNTVQYQNTQLASATTYWYRIRAKNASGVSAYSNVATAKTPQLPPDAPGELAAIVISQTQVNLAWTDQSDNETGFHLERSLDGNNFTRLADLGANVEQYANMGLSPSTLYYYRLRALNAAGFSAYTAVVSARTLNIPVPNAPQQFSAVPIAPGMIRLRWLPVTGNAAEVVIERAKGSDDENAYVQLVKLPANATEFIDTTRLAIDNYNYRAKATNAGGSSSYSLIGIVRPNSIITSAPGLEDWDVYVAGKTLITEKVPTCSTLRIYNMQGIELMENTLSGSGGVDLNALSAGIYIVLMEKGGVVISRKIVLY